MLNLSKIKFFNSKKKREKPPFLSLREIIIIYPSITRQGKSTFRKYDSSYRGTQLISKREAERGGTHTHTVSQRPDSTNAGVLWLVVGGPASRLSIEMRTDARISRFPPRNIIAATSVASDSSRTLLADGARNSRGHVHQLPRLSPGRGGDRFLGGRSDLSRFSLERHSNRPRYRDHRCGPDASRVTRFVLCVFSQSCLKARLHLLLMPCCSISFIDTIKPREERVYFILFLGSFSNKWKEI